MPIEARMQRFIRNEKLIRGAVDIKSLFSLSYIRKFDESTYSLLFQIIKAIERGTKSKIYMPLLKGKINIVNAILGNLAVMIKSAEKNSPAELKELKLVYKDLALFRYNLIKYEKTEKINFLLAAIKFVQPKL